MSTTSGVIVASLNRTRSCCLAVVVAICPQPSFAQRVKSEVQVQLRSPTKPSREKAKMRKGVSRSFEVKADLVDGIDESLRYLRKTVSGMKKDSTTRRTVLGKMLNLVVEQAAYVSYQEQEEFDQKWEVWDEAGRKGSEPRLDESGSRKQWAEVLKIARTLLADFPNDKHADNILFNEAVGLTSLGRESEAVQSYMRITREFPKSEYAGNAHLALGDYYFDRANFQEATRSFRRATAFKNQVQKGWALFKLGWCYYNLSNYSGSLTVWKQAVAMSKKLPKSNGERLRKEILRDMVFAFVETGKGKEGLSLYKRERDSKNLRRLIQQFIRRSADQDNFKLAVSFLNQFSKLLPADPKLVDSEMDLLDVLFRKGQYQLLVQRMADLPKKYMGDSQWARKNSRISADTAKSISETLAYYSKLMHMQADRLANQKLYDYPIAGYKIFLKYFSDGPIAVEVREYLADIAYRKGDFSFAASQYLQIVKMGKKGAVIVDLKKRKKSIHKRVSVNMLDAFSRDISPLLQQLAAKPNQQDLRKKILQKGKAIQQGCQLFARDYPRDRENAKNCEVIQGEVYLRTGQKKSAQKALLSIAKAYPGSPEGLRAAENLIPLLASDKKALADVTSDLLKIPAYKKSGLGAKLKNLVYNLEIGTIAEEKSSAAKGKKYEKLATMNPAAPEAPQLLFNAMIAYSEVGATKDAERVAGQFASRYPRSKLFPSIQLQRARLLEADGRFVEAADVYATYGQKFPNVAGAGEAFGRGCHLAVVFGSARSLTVCAAFAARYPDAGRFHLEYLMDEYFLTRDATRFNAVATQLLRLNISGLEKSRVLAATYRFFGGQSVQGRGAVAQLMSMPPSALAPDALSLRAESLFARMELGFKQSMGLKLQGGAVTALQSSIVAASSALVRLEQGYGQLFQLKQADWAIAGLTRLGQAHVHVANLLAIPPKIDGARPQDVKQQLAPSKTQIEQKAQTYFETAIKTADEAKVFSKWPRRAKAGLAGLKGKSIESEQLDGEAIPVLAAVGYPPESGEEF